MGQRRASFNLPVELVECILGQPELSCRDVLRCKTVRSQGVLPLTFPGHRFPHEYVA